MKGRAAAILACVLTFLGSDFKEAWYWQILLLDVGDSMSSRVRGDGFLEERVAGLKYEKRVLRVTGFLDE